jgi:hypothetical protein
MSFKSTHFVYLQYLIVNYQQVTNWHRLCSYLLADQDRPEANNKKGVIA